MVMKINQIQRVFTSLTPHLVWTCALTLLTAFCCGAANALQTHCRRLWCKVGVRPGWNTTQLFGRRLRRPSHCIAETRVKMHHSDSLLYNPKTSCHSPNVLLWIHAFTLRTYRSKETKYINTHKVFLQNVWSHCHPNHFSVSEKWFGWHTQSQLLLLLWDFLVQMYWLVGTGRFEDFQLWGGGKHCQIYGWLINFAKTAFL